LKVPGRGSPSKERKEGTAKKAKRGARGHLNLRCAWGERTGKIIFVHEKSRRGKKGVEKNAGRG